MTQNDIESKIILFHSTVNMHLTRLTICVFRDSFAENYVITEHFFERSLTLNIRHN